MIVPFIHDAGYVTPPIRAMSEGDIETFDFDAKEPIDTVTAKLRNKWTGTEITLIAIKGATNHSLVTVKDQMRGSSYDVLVSVVAVSGRTFTRKLYVPVTS